MQVRLADMSEELQQSAQDIAVLAFQEHTLEKDRAQYIKKEMDRCVQDQARHVVRRMSMSKHRWRAGTVDATSADSNADDAPSLPWLDPITYSFDQYRMYASYRQHGQTWHCIVGKNFGSYVTHETGNFIYFYLHSAAIVSGTHPTLSATLSAC